MSGQKTLAVVTGGGSGLGEATCHRLAKAGHAIAVLDRNVEGAESVAAAIGKAGGKARAYACDVADANAMEAIARQVEADMGPADVLVTCAGLIPNTEAVMEMDMVAHERMWAVNYHGTLHSCRAFARQMIPLKRGAIVTIGSINSILPMPLPGYNVGKAAVYRLTQILAAELGRHSIRVNSVGPTYVMTPPLKARVASGQRDLKKMMAVHALPYLPAPSDIADAVAFLCSAEARTITGVLLPVDSGWSSALAYNTYAGGVPWEGE